MHYYIFVADFFWTKRNTYIKHHSYCVIIPLTRLALSLKNKDNDIEKWSWSLSLRLVYPVLHKPPGATIAFRSAVRIRINFWRMVGLYISFGDWANALECWRSPSLRLVIPGIAVSPGVTHSDSRIVFVTGTVVKPPTTLKIRTLKKSRRDWSTRYCTYRRERPSLLDLLSEFGLISDGWLGSISPLGDWANALECWRSPSLRLVIPGIAVPPGVTHSDSHHLWYEHCRKTSTTTNRLKILFLYIFYWQNNAKCE